MKNNNLNTLNDTLFDTIKGLQEGKIDVKTAATIKGLGDTVINGAKTLLQAHKQAGSNNTPEFFDLPEASRRPVQPALPKQPQAVKSIAKSAGELVAQRNGYASVAEYRAAVGETVYTEELRKAKNELKDANSRM